MGEIIAYLDANATTQPAPGVVEAVTSALEVDWGNPSSPHQAGNRARVLLDQARSDVAFAIGVDPIELVFTNNATEAINTAVVSSLLTRGTRRKVVTCVAEHTATLHACDAWSQALGPDIQVVKVAANTDGTPDMAEVLAAIDDSCALVSLLWANNELGSITDLKPIQQRCLETRTPLHIDATQALGKLPVDLRRMGGVSMASFSAHKAYGPKGVGCLYLRRGNHFAPLVVGGDQERGRRAGSEAMPAIAGFGASMRWLSQLPPESWTAMAARYERLKQGLQGLGCAFHQPSAKHVNNTLSTLLPVGVSAQAAVAQLSRLGVACSMGAACSAGRSTPSHVMAAIGVDEAAAARTLRLSLQLTTTDAEIEHALQQFAQLLTPKS